MKRILTLTLSFVIAIAAVLPVLPPTVSAKSMKFTDVKETSDYYADVYTLVERGIISGYKDLSFKPNADITRGQAAKILANALELKIEPVTKSQFVDVTVKNQYLPYIEALVKKEIINGYNDDTFKPQNTLTRAQMAKILVRGFNLSATTENLPFTDVTTKSSYYGDIQALYSAGITKGNTATTYSPNNAVKRGQMASFVMRSERATVANTDEKQVNASIIKVEGQQITLSSGIYKITENLQALLSEKNNSALKNAVITATVKGNELLMVASLTITAQGTSSEPVILNGAIEQGPTASVTPVGANIVSSFDGTLLIESNYISINNLKVMNEIVVSSKVLEMSINHYVSLLSILEGGEATIQGLADVDKMTVATDKPIKLQLAGVIKELQINIQKAAIQLGLTSKVNAIKTVAGVKVDSLISNYTSVKTNILKVNGEVNVPGNLTPPSTPGGDSSDDSTPPSPEQPLPSKPVISKTLTGIIKTTSAASILIDGQAYEIPNPKMAKFLHSSNHALENSEITVLIQGNKILDVKSLIINNTGIIDGGFAEVSGYVEINADDVTLTNLTVNGDLLIKTTVTTAFTSSKLIVKGTTIVEEEKVVSRNARSVAATNPARFLADNSTTTVTITFSDSTIAKFVINKKDITMNADGSSYISAISVEATGTILTAGNILPQIIIKGNATTIKLNATVRDIKVETNEPIEITGNANVRNLDINSTNEVKLNVNGIIQDVAVKNEGKISFGTELNVGTIVLPGNKEIKDVINDYDNVSGQINVENTVNTDDVNKPFAAGLQSVEKRYGYHTIQTEFTKGKQVRYLLMNGSNDSEEIPTFTAGDKAPSDSLVYNNEEFALLLDGYSRIQNIVVFLTETDGTILEYEFIETNNNVALYFPYVDFTIKDNKLILKTIFKDSTTPKNALGYVRMYTNLGVVAEQVILPTDGWIKHDGLNSVEIAITGKEYITNNYYLSTRNNSRWTISSSSDEFLSLLANNTFPFIEKYPEYKSELMSDVYRYLVQSTLGDKWISTGPKEGELLYDLKTEESTLEQLKVLAKLIFDFKLILGEAELGFVPTSIYSLEGEWMKNPRSAIKNNQVEILAGPIGTYNFEVRDANSNKYMLEVTFSKDGINGFKTTENVVKVIKEQIPPFVLTSTIAGTRVDINLTFSNQINPADLELSFVNSPLHVTANDTETVFSIYSEDGNFKGKTLTVKYLDNLFVYSIDMNNQVQLVNPAIVH